MTCTLESSTFFGTMPVTRLDATSTVFCNKTLLLDTTLGNVGFILCIYDSRSVDLRSAHTALEAVLLLLRQECNTFESDKNTKGNAISGSKNKKIYNYINKQGLTKQQKSYLYECLKQ